MKTSVFFVLILAVAAIWFSSAVAIPIPDAGAAVPKYDPATEAVFKGTVQELRDRECAMSGGMGSHIVLKLGDGRTIEVHLASTKFVKTYELVFEKGDVLEVTGSKVKFEDVDTIFAREVKRGNDVFVFRDKEGKPVW